MTIPVIDFESLEVADQAILEFKHRGFVFIKNYPMPDELLEKAYVEWADFFQQPLGMKSIYHFNSEKLGPKDGYFPLLSERAKGMPEPDIKEFYHFYPWGQIPHHILPITLKVHENLLKLGLLALNWIGKGLLQSLSETLLLDLLDMVDHCETTVTRVLHYPPLNLDGPTPGVRSAAHEDINLLTVYPAATQEGLEFKDLQGQWHKVPCDPKVAAIGIGDMLALASRGAFQATTHRVMNPPLDKNYSRYAFLLFLHAKNYVQLSPEHTAGSYLAQRFRENGVLTQRTPKIHQRF